MQPNNKEQSHMVKPEDGVRMIKPEWGPATMVAQVKYDQGKPQIPDGLSAIAAGKERIFTLKGVYDGVQQYSEGIILDVDPSFAHEMCDRVFEGSHAHMGEMSEHNAPRHKIKRAIRLKDLMRQIE